MKQGLRSPVSVVIVLGVLTAGVRLLAGPEEGTAIFCGAHSHIFFELFVEVVNVGITDSLGNLIYLQVAVTEQLFRMLDTDVINIGVEAFVYGLCEDFAKVSTVISKKWSNGLQLDVVLVIVIDVRNNIIKDIVCGWITRSIHYHLELFREEEDNLVKVVLFVYILNDGRV